MTVFKPGMRVRIARSSGGDDSLVIGVEGVIARRSPAVTARPDPTRNWDWVVDIGRPWHGRNELAPSEVYVFSEQLDPLTDPKADEFIESIKRMDRDAHRLPVPALVE